MNENNHSRVKTKTKRPQKPVKTSNDFSYILPSTLQSLNWWISPRTKIVFWIWSFCWVRLYKNYYLLLCWIDWVSSASPFSSFNIVYSLSVHTLAKRRVQNRIAFRQRTNSICLRWLDWQMCILGQAKNSELYSFIMPS